jgi:hypothetical protein
MPLLALSSSLAVVVACATLMVLIARPAKYPAKKARRGITGLRLGTLLLLACGLGGLAASDADRVTLLLAGFCLVGTGAYLMTSKTRSRDRRSSVPHLLLLVLLAAVLLGLPIGAAVTVHSQTSDRQREMPQFDLKSQSGFGPARPAFGCRKPRECPGPQHVVFDSFENNPVDGDERRFFAWANPYSQSHAVVDSLRFSRNPPRAVTLRVFIDNDTYQYLNSGRNSAALGTHLRLVLPQRPVYEAFPTMYLYARNADPKVVWDTVAFTSARPMRLEYVSGSARVERREGKANGPLVRSEVPGNLASGAGVDLGQWKADFPYSGFVTFQVRVRPVPEPVRNPELTFGVGGNRAYAPARKFGLGKAPEFNAYSGSLETQYKCSRIRCVGPLNPALNVYLNHPLLGDEEDFVRAASNEETISTGVEKFRPVVVVRAGQILSVRVSIDNGADPDGIGAPSISALTARNVRAVVFLPQESGRDLAISAILFSKSTAPEQAIANLAVRSDEDIRLRRVPSPPLIESASGDTSLAGKHLFLTSHGIAINRRGPIVAKRLPPSFSAVRYITFSVRVLSG